MIVYKSIHHKNTEKIAKAMAEVMKSKLIESSRAEAGDLVEHDLVGFGSGIYHNQHHQSILDLVDDFPKVDNKKAFIFSTSGVREVPIFHEYNKPLEKKLKRKKFNIVDIFSCRGWDTNGWLEIFGGINKGRPNKQDLEKAQTFALDVLNQISES